MNLVEVIEVKNTVEITSDTQTKIVEIVSDNQIVVVQTSGLTGVGVPSGGNTGQMLVKNSDTNYDTEWVDQEVSRSDYRNTFLLMGA